MDWIQSVSKAINYIEANLTNELDIEDISRSVYSSGSHFQRIFTLVTGLTMGDYIRNRRLSSAGQELMRTRSALIDIALKYRYETPESFSKAFTRFHGATPSRVRKEKHGVTVFRPLTVTVAIQGGFDMSRKIIDNIPLHQLQYPDQGQNYVFNGCMKYLMECMNEDERFDYWFFSAVSGDCYVQVFGTDTDRWHTCFSQSRFDSDLIKRVFDAIGYGFISMDADVWRSDKEGTKARLMASIDKGIPVIGGGFSCPPGNGHGEWPTDEVSCIIGYENDGERFYRLPEEATALVPFSLDDPHAYTFVFIGEKRTAPPMADVYRKALLNAPVLMRTPPDKDVFYGEDAFEQWAAMLEGGFFRRMRKEEFERFNSIAQWRYYCVYVCMLATNTFSKQNTTDRAIRLNPDLVAMAPLLDKEYQALKKLELKLVEAGGWFDATYEVLHDSGKRRAIAGIIREAKRAYARIRAIIEQRS
jgi:AraC-like DNA-binding protein